MKNQDLARKLLRLCETKGLTLALAESCTGGAMAACLTSIVGASKSFAGSIVSYRDQIKSDVLHVPGKILKKHGAVSESVARKMLEGCLEIMSADLGIAVTGVAGPGGGTARTPVGTVWVATGFRGKAPSMHKYHLHGERNEVIRQAVEKGLSSAVELIGLPPEALAIEELARYLLALLCSNSYILGMISPNNV